MGNVTHLAYIGPRATPGQPGDTLPRPGGNVIYLVAQAAIPVGYLVAVNSANDLQVSIAASASTAVLGVCIGYRDPAKGEQMGVSPAAGQLAMIQTSGIVSCVADAAITRGALLQAGSTTPGRVLPAGTTFGTVVGTALQSAAAAGNGVLVLLQ